jgi:hypothetical protein
MSEDHQNVLRILNEGIDTLAEMSETIDPPVPSLSPDSQTCLNGGRQMVQHKEMSPYIIGLSRCLEEHVRRCNQLCNEGCPTFKAWDSLRLQLAVLCDELLDEPSDCDDSDYDY